MQRSGKRQNLRVFKELKRTSAKNKGGGVWIETEIKQVGRDQSGQLGRTL